ncbi:MAG: 30S ribosomal protein S6 [Clostridiales bacterium]|nr:30S ribosomal protein S6 [Clostridiales bacterium]
MNKYELVVIYSTKLSEEILNKKIDDIKNIIYKFNGTVIDIDIVGKRYLSYEIKKQSEGIYYFINFDAPVELPKYLENELRIQDDVLRYLILKRVEKKARKKIKRNTSDENADSNDGQIVDSQSDINDSENKIILENNL